MTSFETNPLVLHFEQLNKAVHQKFYWRLLSKKLHLRHLCRDTIANKYTYEINCFALDLGKFQISHLRIQYSQATTNRTITDEVTGGCGLSGPVNLSIERLLPQFCTVILSIHKHLYSIMMKPELRIHIVTRRTLRLVFYSIGLRQRDFKFS
jgi:hypothetical protein